MEKDDALLINQEEREKSFYWQSSINSMDALKVEL